MGSPGGDMEKYGVEIDQEKTKSAALDTVCESCGQAFSADLVTDGRCPHCGSTKNFEKRP